MADNGGDQGREKRERGQSEPQPKPKQQPGELPVRREVTKRSGEGDKKG